MSAQKKFEIKFGNNRVFHIHAENLNEEKVNTIIKQLEQLTESEIYTISCIAEEIWHNLKYPTPLQTLED